MADPHRVSSDQVEAAIPLIKDILANHTRADEASDDRVAFRVAHFTADMSHEVRETIAARTQVLPYLFEAHEATAIEDSAGIVLYVNRNAYNAALRPTRVGEPVDDRLYRLLDYCGHRGLSGKLRKKALDDAAERFGRNGF